MLPQQQEVVIAPSWLLLHLAYLHTSYLEGQPGSSA
jgi:hypothetical protein